MTYTGLPESLRQEVLARDWLRCRWCGSTNQGGDLHHIDYRRGSSYDYAGNLITLCRQHHSFVHGTPNKSGQTITKKVAQLVLRQLVARPGTTGSATWRSLKSQWARDGLCEHGEWPNECADRDLHPLSLRAEPGWDGRTVYRCDMCGCGVTADHSPGSADCREAADERRRSQSD